MCRSRDVFRWGWVVLTVPLFVGSPANIIADDWLRFRGDNGTGISVDADAPLAWSGTQNLNWKAKLPGPGFSSPIVVENKVFVTSYSGYGLSRDEPGEIENLVRHLICLGRKTGEILWSADVPADLPEDPFSGPGVPTHGYASHTPTSDGKHVYAFFGKSGVFAFDMDGEKIWHTKVGEGSDPRAWGSAASLVLHEDRLIVNASAESSAIIALDKTSGKEVWRAEAEGLQQTWSTPVIVADDSGTQLVIASPAEVWGLNAESGKLKWYAAGSEASGMATSLIADGGVVYCVGGMMGGRSFAVKTGGKDDVSASQTLWTGRGLSQFGTGVLHQGHIFGASETGIAYCINAENGDVAYQARLDTGEAAAGEASSGGQGRGQTRRQGGQRGGRRGGGGMGNRSYGSAVLVNGHVLFTNHGGTTYVFAANPEKFELIHKNSLGAESDGFNATPAVSDGAIFIRSNKHLYCISKD